jgi:hypothetical protein
VLRLLAGTSQAFCQRLRGRSFGAGVAPEFMPKRNSKLIGTRGRTADDGGRLEIGENQGPVGSGRETSREMNAGPRTGLRRRVSVPAPESKEGDRADRDGDVRVDSVAKPAGGEDQVHGRPTVASQSCCK